jgi:hypothetical protein
MKLLPESCSGEDKNGERIQGFETSIQAHYSCTVSSVHETPIDIVCHAQLCCAVGGGAVPHLSCDVSTRVNSLRGGFRRELFLRRVE